MTNTEELKELCKSKNFNKELAESLIKNINFNQAIESEETTFLYLAVTSGNIDMVKFLLDNGADPNYFTEDDGPVLWELQHTAFFEMEEKQRLELVKLLLEYGADPNIVSWDEPLFDYITYKVFNEADSDDWDYIVKFFIYLVAYGGSTNYCRPIIYKEFDKSCMHEYKFRFIKKGSRGKIVRKGRRIAYI